MRSSASAISAPLRSRSKPAAAVRGALAALSLSMLLSSLGTSIANVALPTLAQVFAASFQEVQWVVLVYLLATTSLVVGVGRLGDMIGRRRLLLAGLMLFTAASAFGAVAPSLGLVVAARAIQGLGASAMMALTMAFVGESVPAERTGSAMGLLGTTSAVGTALGPSLGGVLIAAFGWRAIFVVNLPLGLIALALAYRYLPVDREAAKTVRAGFDYRGTLLLAATLTAYALAMTIGRGHFGMMSGVLVAMAIMGVAAFVAVEKRMMAPLIQFSLFRDPVLRGGLVTSLLVATVVMATLVVGPFYLSRGLGLDTAMVGAVVAVGPIVAALAGVPAGRLTDRYGANRMTIVGLGGVAFGSLLLAGLPTVFGVPAYIGAIVVTTAGYALFQTANNTEVMADVPRERRGVISGMLTLSRSLGLVTGSSAMGAIFAAAAGASDMTAALPANIAFGMRVTFATAAVLIVGGLALMRTNRKRAASL